MGCNRGIQGAYEMDIYIYIYYIYYIYIYPGLSILVCDSCRNGIA